ncbi:MAG: transcription termination/antitermination protein NusG [Burkholderiales bacterium]|nr:transcription termination/antitermination protein NusG [Burkholderiales bacterium]
MSTDKKWYVVHTYSGMEKSAESALRERIKRSELDEMFGEILVPTEDVSEVKNGKKRVSTRRLYSGYIFVNMSLNEETWHLVKNTPRITGFLGESANKPTPISNLEIDAIKKRMESADEPRPRFEFQTGEQVRIKSGPFADFNGTIDEVDYERNRLRVIVSIFSRDTPVELTFTDVEKN